MKPVDGTGSVRFGQHCCVEAEIPSVETESD